jgi:putative NADPH-quinone reductase
VLHEGHHTLQPLEPDLVLFQEKVLWAQHIVIVYPTWWGGMPAILKGLFDRSFYTGFAYRYHEKGPFWDKLLKGRSAHIITTMDAPRIWYWLAYRSAGNNMLKRAILHFCGIGPVKTTLIGQIKDKSQEALAKDLEAVSNMASKLH